MPRAPRDDASRARLIKTLLCPAVVDEIAIVAISDTNWMAQAVLADGTGKRFRCVRGTVHDESAIGDARA